MATSKIYSLSVILKRIQNILENQLNGIHFWLKVEISSIKQDRNGHFYLELIETSNQQIIAKSRATIWNSSVRGIQQQLGNDFQSILKDGSEILCYSEVVFSPTYGLSLNITHVDLNFSMGEVERKKQLTLQQLTKEQLIDKNKQHILPLVIQHVALIGSPSTSGHEDFLKQLANNSYGFQFTADLFPCTVQGDRAVASIIEQLNRLEKDRYDAIIIIRGGGSKFDLEPFNDYDLAYTIANHHTAILTGIGHETDTSIADIVANQSFKTPSAVAAFIVERAYHFWVNTVSIYNTILTIYEQTLQNNQKDIKYISSEIASQSTSKTRLIRGLLHQQSNRIITEVNNRLAEENSKLHQGKVILGTSPFQRIKREQLLLNEGVHYIDMVTKSNTKEQQIFLDIYQRNLIHYSKNILQYKRIHLDDLEGIPSIYEPMNTLRRGFALVQKNNIFIRENEPLEIGDQLDIYFYNKTLSVTVNKNVTTWKTTPTKALQKN